MAGLVPAIHASPYGIKNVDARDKPGLTAIAWSVVWLLRRAHALQERSDLAGELFGLLGEI
ncbi:hypothetical protein [Bradyrhizobium sp. STM 3566]|uniref:hypothetical protein n=1 Tax=Bradyrhizobium sp. STM 3566 TaxID=578928 RepID=UPI00388F61F3